MAKKDQGKHSKRKDEDKDFGLPEIEITPISSEEEKSKPAPKATPAPVPISNATEKKVDTKQSEEKSKEEPLSKEEEPKEVEPVVVPPVAEEKAKVDETKPAAVVEPKASQPVVPPSNTVEEKEESSSKTWLIVLLIFLLGIIGYAVYYFNYQPVDVNADSNLNQAEEAIQPVQPEESEEIPAPVEPEVSAPIASSTPAMTEINEKGDQPRYLVTVGAFIDGDLAKDFSKKLNNKGYNTYLILPGYGSSFYKLAIADFDNVVDATAMIEKEQANFEETLWVFKY
ncbi:SPOR domain-containing protein [Echinicola sp. 20G]|uniref:SPOR domain-containing protein n=1 Tax=Echinicola sp. 20G TaxID=2781961 RepID=UPI00191001CC|nr:SPOR domain-containing protein [Echinicola sp. 20G]